MEAASMFHKSKAPRLCRESGTAEMRLRIPRIALRERSKDHPMAMFATLVTAAFLSMAVMAPANAILAAPEAASSKLADPVMGSGKTSRLQRPANVDRACQGQAWGAETEDCLLAILKGSGRSEARRIRLVASADPIRTTPNMF
jgi:hypothetical protein